MKKTFSVSTVEFSPNSQSWQHWHFFTISNGYKLEIVENWIKLNANLHLRWCFELILKWLLSLSYIFLNTSNTKMPTLPTSCITGKLDRSTYLVVLDVARIVRLLIPWTVLPWLSHHHVYKGIFYESTEYKQHTHGHPHVNSFGIGHLKIIKAPVQWIGRIYIKRKDPFFNLCDTGRERLIRTRLIRSST